jgi:hypothetical protein
MKHDKLESGLCNYYTQVFIAFILSMKQLANFLVILYADHY